MESGESRNHVGLNCSLDELIRKEVPNKPDSKRVLKRSNFQGNNSPKRKQTGQNRGYRRSVPGFQFNYITKSYSSHNVRHNRERSNRVPNDRRNKDTKMRTELDMNNSIPAKDPGFSNISERERIIKMISIIHDDKDFTMQILLDSSPIIIVNKITGVIQLNSFSCRSHIMLEIWNLLLKPLGLSLVNSSSDVKFTNWLITDGSCYMESFKDGMIVRGSGSRDTARNARFSILEQHIRQLIV
ncbi:hypothetical protein FG386_001234 [Cryptosporidium ryanae]|uniref:uncharacterized protein n=1 Tax=Cryptosporidium ryanae TaxID=515981 RepID=UPI003519DF98|nr:hypothetical protein FG386_001234 [Cryptosporidium ryanae]